MKKIKLFLNKQLCERCENIGHWYNDISLCFDLCSITSDLINLTNYNIIDVKVIKDAPTLYSLMIRLEEKEKNGKK